MHLFHRLLFVLFFSLASTAEVLPQSFIAHEAENCYRRLYSHTHLARHPNQLVTSMRLALRKLSPKVRHAAGDEFEFGMSVIVSLRGNSQELNADTFCRWVTLGRPNIRRALRCPLECDGGGLVIEPRKNDIYVHLQDPPGFGYIALSAECDAVDESVYLSSGLDDKVFRLERANAEECRF